MIMGGGIRYCRPRLKAQWGAGKLVIFNKSVER